MKTSNFKKVISIMLMCFMLVGTLVGFSVSAADAEPTVAIVSNNVEFGDDLKLMYAVDATNVPEGGSIKVVLYNEDGDFIANTVASGDVTIDGVTLPTFTSEYGVAAQNIATVICAEAQIVDAEGNVLATSAIQEYSILEYLWERKTLCDPEDYQIAMYDALLAYAEALDIAVNKGTATADNAANFSYVAVVDEEGIVEASMYLIGDEIYALPTDLVAGDGEYIKWTIDEYKPSGVASRSVREDDLAENGYTVTENAVVFSASVEEEGGNEPVIGTEKLSIFATTGVMGTKTISWTGDHIIFTNNQDKSSTGIRNHTDTDHYRIYKSSQVVISTKNGEKITKLVITSCGGSNYQNPWKTTLENAGYTVSVSGAVYTITFAEGVSEITLTASAQMRLNAIEVTYVQ